MSSVEERIKHLENLEWNRTRQVEIDRINRERMGAYHRQRDADKESGRLGPTGVPPPYGS